jgi:protein-disulfide isomerase
METTEGKQGPSAFFEKYGTAIAVLVGALVIGAALIFSNGGMKAPADGAAQPVAVDIKDVKTDGNPFIGSKNAPVTMAVWFDYQCPFCKQLELGALAEIYSAYVTTGKVRVVFKDFQFLGDDSDTGALYARAVWDAYPDRWYDWYRAMAEHQDDEHTGFGSLETITAMTKELGLDTDRIAKLMKDKETEYKAAIAADRDEGTTFGINGTPSVIIGKTLLSGAQPFSAFQPLIDAALK